MKHALSIDVEDYFQVSAFESQISRSDWHNHESRVVANTRRILRILEETDTRATFYVLGWVAKHFPDIVHEISAAGHEIGSHSYWHRLIYEMSPQEFADDLGKSLEALSDITGERIETYRAPSFSVTRQSLWALEVLARHGISTDTSIYPVVHDRYGISDAPTGIHWIETDSGTLLEFPPAVMRWGGQNFPVGGGGYFRFWPLAVTLRALKHLERSGQPFVFYLHPWEIDPGQPRLRTGSMLSRWRHYLNLDQVESRLRTLLKTFEFAPIREVVKQVAVRPERVRSVESLCGVS